MNRILRICCRWHYLLAACLLWHTGAAQEPVTGTLPDSLQQDAGMVKRMDVTQIDIESPKKARIHHKYVYTILNEKGENWSRVATFYDRYHDLVSATATLYDAAGKPLKKVKKSELEDWNIDGMGILMMDIRLKYYKFGYHVYPYSISFDEEMDLNGLFSLPPQWTPQPSPQVSVVNSRLVITTPVDYVLDYKSYHLPDPVILTEKKKTYTWQLDNRPASGTEPYASAWYSREARVDLAPGTFEIEGYHGSFDSWEKLGLFMDNLYLGRGQLPAEARQKVHALVDSLTDDREKIKVLYDFLQRNTHYVGIELGIGGWQPYDAAYVYTKKYGDCKALANYMVALLKEAGIRACPVLIRAGAEAAPIDTGFACNEFNHVIAAAFTARDTIWLECTSQTLPAGYLSSFTADRNALLLDGTGGHIVHTPVYGVRDNRLSRTLKGVIDEHGNLQGALVTDYSGLEQDGPQSMVDRLPKKDLVEQRRQSLGLPNCTISDLQYRSTRAAVPELEESMKLSSEGFVLVSGNRMMITPGVFLKRLPRLQESAAVRKTDVELKQSVEETDSIVFQLPPGWVHEGNFPNISSSSVFGSYRFRASFSDETFTLICHFRQQKGVYPAEDYARLVHLFDLVYREGNRQFVFVRSAGVASGD